MRFALCCWLLNLTVQTSFDVYTSQCPLKKKPLVSCSTITALPYHCRKLVLCAIWSAICCVVSCPTITVHSRITLCSKRHKKRYTRPIGQVNGGRPPPHPMNPPLTVTEVCGDIMVGHKWHQSCVCNSSISTSSQHASMWFVETLDILLAPCCFCRQTI